MRLCPSYLVISFRMTPSVTYRYFAHSSSPRLSSESELSILSLKTFSIEVCYVVVDEMGRDGLPFLFSNDPFLEPPHRLPALELYEHFIAGHVFKEIEEDVTIDGVSCNVKRLIDLDEDRCHLSTKI
jgi:hypothetical protein